MTRRSPKPLRKKLRSLYSWHRWLGVISALFVIWLAVTGIALEHSHQWSLDQRSASNPSLLKYFGIDISPPDAALNFQEHWLSHVDGHLYLDTQLIDQGAVPVGFSRLGLIWVVASREQLWLLNDQAEVLEKIEGLDLPGRITALGNDGNALHISTTRGTYTADPLSADWPAWQTSSEPVTVKYAQSTLPVDLQNSLVQQARNIALSWERVLVEAHSGRLLGPYGVWLMDAMAIIFIILAVTGISLWLRYQRAARKRRTKLKFH